MASLETKKKSVTRHRYRSGFSFARPRLVVISAQALRVGCTNWNKKYIVIASYRTVNGGTASREPRGPKEKKKELKKGRNCLARGTPIRPKQQCILDSIPYHTFLISSPSFPSRHQLPPAGASHNGRLFARDALHDADVGHPPVHLDS